LSRDFLCEDLFTSGICTAMMCLCCRWHVCSGSVIIKYWTLPEPCCWYC